MTPVYGFSFVGFEFSSLPVMRPCQGGSGGGGGGVGGGGGEGVPMSLV